MPVPPGAGAPGTTVQSGEKAKKESDALLREALSLAGSSEPSDHARLLSELKTKSYLMRLDSTEDYRRATKTRLRLERVLRDLATNPAASAQKALFALARNKTFLADEERRLALIRAGQLVRPAPPQLVAFWDAHSRAGDMFTATTIEVLVANGSDSALRLFERKLADRARRKDEKIAWLHTDVLTHRNDLGLLKACERMLRGRLPKSLRPVLVESLFDYRPGEWYRPASPHSAPPLRDASPEALDVLQSLGERALGTVDLTDTQREAIARKLEEAKKLREAKGAP